MADVFHGTGSLLALVVAFLALAVSILTAWLTLIRKGEILMTQPTVIYFGPDGGSSRPTMRFVAVKSEAQQARAMLFRTRDLLVRQRTQLAARQKTI